MSLPRRLTGAIVLGFCACRRGSPQVNRRHRQSAKPTRHRCPIICSHPSRLFRTFPKRPARFRNRRARWQTISTRWLAPRAYWSSPTFWNGFYAGGQVSYSSASGDFTDSTQAPIAYSLRELTLESEFQPSTWPVLGTDNHSAAGFGGFVGYNFQYLKAVFGLEANYDQAALSRQLPNSPISRVTPADTDGNVHASSTSPAAAR